VSLWHVRKESVMTVQHIVNQNIDILRARAERYRRLAEDLFDPKTSEEAASLAQELDAEIARLQTQPQPALAVHCF
jgi:hypothetical protein